EPACGGELLDLLPRAVGVLADAEPEVEPRRVVTEVGEHVPQREAVLAARDRDQDPLAGDEHTLCVDRALHLPAEEEQVAGPAEGGVVRAELDLGPRTAPPALHQAPPEMTAVRCAGRGPAQIGRAHV